MASDLLYPSKPNPVALIVDTNTVFSLLGDADDDELQLDASHTVQIIERQMSDIESV